VTDADRADEIQRQMAELRIDLHRDVEGIVDSARALADWRYYVRKYPWVCLGGAAVLGYLIVPGRLKAIAPDVETLVALAKKHQLFITPKPEAAKQKSIVGSLVGLAASAALRGAMGFATEYAKGRMNTPSASPIDDNVTFDAGRPKPR
jgi:hypothetical protein